MKGPAHLNIRPFLCRIGLHHWEPTMGENFWKAPIYRCTRPGCHREKAKFLGHFNGDIETAYWDRILCSCGIEIVHIRENFWRDKDTGEVCLNNHWHEPAK